MKKLFSKLNLIYLIVLVLFLIFAVVKPTDPDLGFHLRIGQRAWQEKSLPDSNWFNYAFPESDWVAHEIVAEVILYLFYSIGQFNLLTLVFSLLMVLIGYLLVFKYPNGQEDKESLAWFAHLFLALLVIISLQFHAGVRLQVLSWLGLIIVYLGYFRWKANKPWSLLTWAIIFLIWANLHNSLIFIIFIIGLIAILSFLFYRRSNWFYWVKVLILNIIATFLQLNFDKLHLEFYRTFKDNYKVNISEWGATSIDSDSGMIFILTFTLFFLSLFFFSPKKIKQVDPTLIILAIIMMFFGFANIRNIPLAMIALFPVFSTVIKLIIGPGTIPIIIPKIFKIIASVILILVLGTLGLKIYDTYQINTNLAYLAQKNDYPYKAVQYLREKGFPQGRVLNDYGWGGFLIYNFPDYEWFIDGRLPHILVTNPNFPDEKFTALQSYQNLTSLRRDPQRALDYYNISWTFLKRNQNINFYLKAKGWKVVYQDKVAMILVKR